MSALRNRVRIYVKRGESEEYKYVAWFRSEGFDLYWGWPQRGRDMSPQPYSAVSKDITVPEEFDDLPKVAMKHSYHSSGLIHTTAPGSVLASIKDEFHGRPEQIEKPHFLSCVITSAPVHYPLYGRSLNRERSSAIVIQVPDSAWYRRHYFDFFLTPSGTFEFPSAPIKMSRHPRVAVVHSLDVERDRILVVRHEVISDGEFAEWQPDKTLSFLPVGLPKAGLEMPSGISLNGTA